MYRDTVDSFSALATDKAKYLKNAPVPFFAASMMAGAYVGVGICLIFSLGNSVPAAFSKLIMGLSFGIALTLVVFAGSELFTGHVMYMTVGVLRRTCSLPSLTSTWIVTWIGNLVGAVALSAIFSWGSAGGFLENPESMIHQVADFKMNSAAGPLFARAILCNWLVCLAVWMCGRTTSDTTKCILIFWCLFAFIACGFEHSVANMTVLTLSLLGSHPDTVSLSGMAHNLFWVTFGNIIGGSVFVGGAYWLVAYKARNRDVRLTTGRQDYAGSE